jgi:cytochrome c peroxidase
MRARLAPTAALAALTGLLSLPGAPASAAGISAAEMVALKESYRRPAARAVEDPRLVDLGRLLFWDPRVSASGKTACVHCHQPHLGWAATDARSRSDSGKPTGRKSQPLVGIGHMDGASYNWDGRTPTLEAQARGSMATGSMSLPEADNPGKLATIERRIAAVPAYAERFAALFPGRPVDADAIAKAIAAFEKTMEPGPAPFDRWIEGDEDAISASAKRGFVLFNGKGGCSACHSGWRFTDDAFHDIGTSKTDRGRGRVAKSDELMQFAFKTPTLRSVALRPPYMHNAAAAGLYEVVRHYETGGIERPSRSPMLQPLQLAEQERLDLVAFMQTLSGVPEGEGAPGLPE